MWMTKAIAEKPDVASTTNGAAESATASTETSKPTQPSTTQLSSPKRPSSESPPTAEATVRAFYEALGRADGATANSLMTPEKREAAAYQADAIKTFYGSMAEPLTLVSIETAGPSDFAVHYRYRKKSAVCDGHAVVTTQDSDGRTLIARIKPAGNC